MWVIHNLKVPKVGIFHCACLYYKYVTLQSETPRGGKCVYIVTRRGRRKKWKRLNNDGKIQERERERIVHCSIFRNKEIMNEETLEAKTVASIETTLGNERRVLINFPKRNCERGRFRFSYSARREIERMAKWNRHAGIDWIGEEGKRGHYANFYRHSFYS